MNSAENNTQAINVTTNFDSLRHVNKCELFDGDDVKCTTLVYVKVTFSALSIFGSLLTIGILVLFQKYKEFTQRMIGNLSLSSLLLGISYLLDNFEKEATPLCVFQGALMTFCVWSIMTWNVCIVANLYRRVLSGIDWRQREIIMTISCWITPLVIASLPFIGGVYGPAGAWCWIINDVRWRFSIWYIWAILSVILFFLITVHIVYTLFRAKNQLQRSGTGVLQVQALHADIRILRMYPVVYFLVHIFPIIGRVQDALHGYSFGVLLLQTVAGPLDGAAVALVYVLDRKTMHLLTKKGIREAIGKWRKKKTQIREYQVGAEFGPYEKEVETESTF